METKFTTGIATGADGHDTATRAAQAARDDLCTDRVDFCQVFCSAAYSYAAVLDAIFDVIGEDTTLVGCSSSGEFTEKGAHDHSVALALVTSDTIRFHSGLGTGLRDDVNGCVREAIREFPDQVDGYPFQSAISLHDGLGAVGEQLAVVSQQKLGPQVSLAGGSAGDDMQMDATHVFEGRTVAEDATAMALLASTEPVGIAVNHGHTPISDPVTVTKADGDTVYELDDRPAFEVWKEAAAEDAREQFGYDLDDLVPGSEALTKFMTRYEFGIDQGRAYKIRWPGLTEQTDGPLQFAMGVPEGTVFRVMHSPNEAQKTAVREAAREARDQLDEGAAAGGFVYDCVCRAVILEDEFDDAVAAIGDELGVPYAGFETYGEVCMERGQTSGYHNTTAVVMVLPR
jgi:methyl-accepting chemotaxis protein